jgi:selenocysteine lyase/cysteine desulfurase
VHSTKSSAEITAVVHRSGIGIRHGHMYAYHLCEALGLDPEDGVVRISLVHYNTMDEVEKLIEVLEVAME